MKWVVPKQGMLEISSEPSHRDPAFALDFNLSIPDQDAGGICVNSTKQTGVYAADQDIEAGNVHSFGSVDDMPDSLGD